MKVVHAIALAAPLFAPLFAAVRTAEPPARKLGPPLSAFDGDFVNIGSAHELPDGRVLVSDFRDGVATLVDLASNSAKVVGRRGEGPLEYRSAGGLYAGVADTVLLLDRGLARMLVIAPTGQPVGTRALSLGGGGRVTGGGETDPFQLDASGRAYRRAYSMMQPSGDQRSPLVRFPLSGNADTVARLREAESSSAKAGAGFAMSRATVFSPSDGWAVLADGSVGVVRADPYRVEWYAADGQRVEGPVIAFDAIRVTDADKAAAERASAGPLAPRMTVRTDAGTSQTLDANSMGPAKYAEFKPPFYPGQVLASRDGRLWVRRYRPAGEENAIYDVFDRSGARIDRIELPARSRVVGFGRGVIYVAELNADDVPHLKKYKL